MRIEGSAVPYCSTIARRCAAASTRASRRSTPSPNRPRANAASTRSSALASALIACASLSLVFILSPPRAGLCPALVVFERCARAVAACFGGDLASVLPFFCRFRIVYCQGRRATGAWCGYRCLGPGCALARRPVLRCLGSSSVGYCALTAAPLACPNPLRLAALLNGGLCCGAVTAPPHHDSRLFSFQPRSPRLPAGSGSPRQKRAYPSRTSVASRPGRDIKLLMWPEVKDFLHIYRAARKCRTCSHLHLVAHKCAQAELRHQPGALAAELVVAVRLAEVPLIHA